MSIDLVGQQIDNYRVDALLGEGGMGSVYRAYDVNLRRTVAIKVMHRHLARQESFQQRFLQEAQSAARLEHPSIIAVHHFDLQQAHNLLYMIMAFIPGGSLGDHMQALAKAQQALPVREALLVAAQIADALDYAHRKGIVHRDIKPDNVLLKRLDEPETPGGLPLRVVVTDFGLAKILEGGLHTSSGVFMGTLPYMSPEQALGRNLDGRSDIYSLGIMLYQLTTGRLPFTIQSPTDAVQKHSREPLPLPTSFLPGFSTALESTIVRATAKKAAARHQDARQLAAELRQLAAQLPADDKTIFVFTSQPAVSLLTRLQSVEPPMPSHLGENLPPLANEDQLIIASQGQPPSTHPLDRSPLLIGRAAEADIVLNDPNISRRHARLERAGTGWQVVDLNSSNGTFLEGSKLLPDVPEPWAVGRTLRLGPYHLRWQPAGGAPLLTPAPGAAAQGTVIPRSIVARPGSTRLVAPGGRLVVDMPNAPIRVTPGQQAQAQVDLLNQDRIVGHYRLAVDGLPPQWTTVTPARMELFPGDQATLSIAVHPPRHSQTTAGTRPFRLVITSEPDGQLVAAADGQIAIEAYGGFASELSPSVLPSGATTRLQIRNDGNSPATFTISGRDPAEAVNFHFTPTPAVVAPGETVTLPVKLAAKSRPWLGREKQLPFELRVQPADGQSQAQPGQLNVRPILPPWVVPLLGALLLFACGLLAFLFDQRNEANANATQVAFTATAQFIAALQTGTAVIEAANVSAIATNAALAAIPAPPTDTPPAPSADTPLAPPTDTPPAPPTDTPPAPPTDTPPAPPTATATTTPTETPTETPTPTPLTPASEALLLDGVDDFATVINRGDFDFSFSFTIEAWIKPVPSAITGRRFTGLVRNALQPALASDAGWALTFNGPVPADNSNSTTLAAMVCTANDCNAAGNLANPLPGQWQHVAATYDGARIVVYLNGSEIDAQSRSSSVRNEPFVLLGAWTHSFSGLIDEVRIWNIARTEEQIEGAMDFRLTGNEPGLVGYWKFNEGGGQQILDSSTRGNHGVLGATDSIESSDPVRFPSDVPLRPIIGPGGIVAPGAVVTQEFELAPPDN